MRFLIIDDDADTADILKTFFDQNGHRSILAFTADEGLKMFFAEKPDAIFLDIMLPDRNGIDLLKEIKKSDQVTPIIMVTGFKEAENVVSAFREGAFDCLLKPFNYEYLKKDILQKLPQKK